MGTPAEDDPVEIEGMVQSKGRISPGTAIGPVPAADTGLTAAADAPLDRFAHMTAKIMHAPVAAVALVDAERTFLPGAVGFGDPWMATREFPRLRQLAPFEAGPGEVWAVDDTSSDERIRDNPLVGELGIGAYAGVSLTDASGQVLGALCVADRQPRAWRSEELDLLGDLGGACSAKLRLRIAARRAEQALVEQLEARAEAYRLQVRVRAALERSQLLLAASSELIDTVTVKDVVAAVGRLASGGLDPVHVSIAVRDDAGQIVLHSDEEIPVALSRLLPLSLREELPVVACVRTGKPVILLDRQSIVEEFPQMAPTADELGWQSVAHAPLVGLRGTIGALTFAWSEPHPIGVEEQAVITTLAGYVTHALQRATHLDDRIAAAQILQRAMLSDLPVVEHLDLATRYQAAQGHDHVGGDWYDAVQIPDGGLALVVGDVVGHDISAAAAMGQLRSLLRAYLVDRHEPPSALLRRLDNANHVLGARTIATAILATLEAGADGWYDLRWSNAGHPPPIVIHPDGRAHSLPGRNPLLGAVRHVRRTNHDYRLPPGATLLLHTDGLTERRGVSIDQANTKLHALLAEHATATLTDLLDVVVSQIPDTGHEDDLALLAVRIPPDPTCPPAQRARAGHVITAEGAL